MNRIIACVVFVLVGGCAAPPLGLGTGMSTLGGPRPSYTITGTAGFGASSHRDAFQAEASATILKSNTGHFTAGLEVGAAYTQVQVKTDAASYVAHGALPYLRPRIGYGPVTLAIGLSGFAFGGGEAGFVGGIADAQLGVGGKRWSAYAGAYAMYYDELGGRHAWARQQRIGGEVWLPTRARLAIVVEAYHQRESLHGAPPDPMTSAPNFYSEFYAAAIKLRADWSGPL